MHVSETTAHDTEKSPTLMETAINEITLVLFTTIAPAGVIGYLLMAAIVRASKKDRADAISRHLVVPLVLAISGLIASAASGHPGERAGHVITGMRRSPLSNEVWWLRWRFLALGGIYWIISFRNDLTRAFRKTAWLVP